MTQNEIQAGTVVGHRYRVERPLGRGSLGSAYLSCDLADGKRLVTLKVFKCRDRDGDLSERLRKQFSVLSRLRHPGLVTILDCGTHGEALSPYLVAEFVEGLDLLKATEEWTSYQIISLLVETCRTLQYLHAREILHGNLKPSNLLRVSGNGRGAGIKLLDFGLIPSIREAKPSHGIGVQAYTAPEAILGETPGPRADLYSVGVIAYQLFSRRLPFEDEDQEYLIQKQLQGSPDMRSIERVEFGPGLVQVLRGLLEKQPEKRPSSSEEVIRLLSAASGHDYTTTIQPAGEFYFSASRFVGRESEMSRLQEQMSRVRETGRGTTVFVQGEAGLGKTRLFEEFRLTALMDGWRVIDSSCIPGEGRSYEPYRSILGRMERISGVGQASSIEAILRAQASAHTADSGLLEHSTEAAASQFRDQLTRELVRQLADRPTVLLLHDFHWADDATTAVLDYLMSDIAVHPVLVCVSLRPLKDDQGPLGRLIRHALRQERATLLLLEPLPDEAVIQMIVSMTGSGDLGRAIGNWLVAASGGNPYFVEETLRHLVDRGVLRRGEDVWALEPNGLEELAVPKGVAMVLQHRLDQLSQAAKEVAAWIAVFDQPVAMELLAKLAGMPTPGLRLAISELLSRQLLQVREEEGRELCHFRHSLILEVLITRLAAPRRRQMHRRIAEAIEALYGTEGWIQDLAVHSTEGRCGEKATEYALKAAALCRGQFAHEAARRFYEYVLNHPGGLSRETICQVAIEAADVYCALGIPRRATRLLHRQQRLLKGPSEARAQLLCRLAYAYLYRGAPRLTIATSRLGLRILARLRRPRPSENLRAMFVMQLAFGELAQSRPQRGLKMLEPLVPVVAGHGALEGQLYSIMSALHRVSCNLRAAVVFGRRAVEILAPLDAPRLFSTAASHLGAYLTALGRLSSAMNHHELAVVASERARSVFQQAQALSNLAECQCRSGSLAESNAISSKILRLASMTENRDWLHVCAGSVIETWICLGKYDEAYESLKAMLDRPVPSLPVYVKAQALYYYSWVHAELGDYRSALRYVGALTTLARSHGPFYEMEMADMVAAKCRHEMPEEKSVRNLVDVHSELRRKRWPYQMCMAELHIAQISLGEGNLAKAFCWARRAIRLAHVMPATVLEATGHLILGCAFRDSIAQHATQKCSFDAPTTTDSDELLLLAHKEFEKARMLSVAAGAAEVIWKAYAGLSDCAMQMGSRDSGIQYAMEAANCLDQIEKHVPPRFLESFWASSNRMQTRERCRQLVEGSRRSLPAAEDDTARMAEDHLRMLYRTSNLLNRPGEIDGLFERIIEGLLEALQVDRAQLYLVRDGGVVPEMVSEKSKGHRTALREEKVHRLVREVHQSGRVLITADAKRDSRFPASPGEILPGTVFVAPLTLDGKRIGVLYCDSPTPSVGVDSQKISFFAAFANMASVILENALTPTQLSVRSSDLELCLAHTKQGPIEITGSSIAIMELRQKISIMAKSPLDVLIIGETGTGKELVARALHRSGPRIGGNFVAVDCGALSETLFESELFGYRKGAFTGASENRAGLFEAANGGVIFLDEISNLTLRSQAKLLRVLQEREVRRIGERTVRKLDIQVIAATNRDLELEIRRGKFRNDLFYRLKAMEIRVPPLRERVEDIPVLAEWFLSRTIQPHGSKKILTAASLKCLTDYPFPGNVRELKNFIESAYYLARDRYINPSDFPAELRGQTCEVSRAESSEAVFELLRSGRKTFDDAVKMPFLERKITTSTVRQIIRQALIASNGRYKQAFRLMQIPERDYSVAMVFLKRHHCYLDFRPFRK